MNQIAYVLILGLFGTTCWSLPVRDALIVNDTYDYEANRPVVKVIKEGELFYDGDKTGVASSITYVSDGPDCQIIVDTGVPTDTKTILRSLATEGILPTSITLVISTHSHPDHVGNQNLFGYANFIVGNKTLDDSYLQTLPPADEAAPDGSKSEIRYVCPNVALAHVRGHTGDDNIILVYNATDYGNLSITGDIFTSADDIVDESLWRKWSAYPEDQKRLRRMLIADSDYIIPGHGSGFQVTDEMREALREDDSQCSCAGKVLYSELASTKEALKKALSRLESEMPILNGNFSDLPDFNFSIGNFSDFVANLTQQLGSVVPPRMPKPYETAWSPPNVSSVESAFSKFIDPLKQTFTNWMSLDEKPQKELDSGSGRPPKPKIVKT